MPEGLPETLWDAQAGAVKVDDLTKQFLDLHKFKTEHDSRATADPRPESADKYALELPKDFTLPEGVQPDQVKIDPNSPLVADFRKWAHEKGIGQATFSELLAKQAVAVIEANKRQVAEYAAMKDAETKKLGENAAARRGAVDSFLKANGFADDETAEINLLKATEAGVRAIEKLIQRANGNAMPGGVPEQRPSTPAQTVEDRWYGSTAKKG